MRLACRVCLALGIDDPEAWLDTVSPRTLAIWSAFYRVEPWGNEYERSAGVAALISAQTAMIAATVAQKMTPQPVSDFMPSNWLRRTQSRARSVVDAESIKKSQRKFASMYGAN